MDKRTIMLELLKLKQHHAYLVDVSWDQYNPIHRAILFMGLHGAPERLGCAQDKLDTAMQIERAK